MGNDSYRSVIVEWMHWLHHEIAFLSMNFANEEKKL